MKKEAQQYYRKKLETFTDKKDRVLNNVDFDIKEVEEVHISGSCGKAMASVAGLFADSGFSVSGSDDACHPPMSIVLDNLGLEYKGFDIENIKNSDVIVVGNVCSPSNIECVHARKNNIPQISGAAAVGEFFIANKKSLVVAGTHGKTTTTSMLAHVFLESKNNPAFLIGGVLQGINTSYSIGDENSEYFIIEGDEYDTAYFDKAPKFLHYKPYISVITSVEYDHADIYKNIDDYRQAFAFLAEETHSDGKIFI
jgi:UDP-N-acetylmuramate: L-alanyl-gamma-D-glutamyl-meso-diaminopimelate ligase